ncbi:MAG: hypothetical protein COA78_22720 [Blastopirellula sp.]|nr:MAG: hypothetical protein COA78_22720 [Blastopirellula sp.]
MMRWMSRILLLAVLLSLTNTLAIAAEPSLIETLATMQPNRVKLAIGKTEQSYQVADDQTLDVIPAWVIGEEHVILPHIMVIGGIEGEQATSQFALDVLDRFSNQNYERQFLQHCILTVVPAVDLQRIADHRQKQKSKSWKRDSYTVGYPPKGTAYSDPKTATQHYLWRFIGTEAPDLVIVLRATDAKRDAQKWHLPKGSSLTDSAIANALKTKPIELPPSHLAVQLDQASPVLSGSIPAVVYDVSKSFQPTAGFLDDVLHLVKQNRPFPKSRAHQTVMKRLKRSPLDLSEQLGQHYGNKLDRVQYIPALALVAKLRIASRTKNFEEIARIKQEILKPYFDGTKKPVIKSGSDLAGHLIFTEAARLSEGKERERFIELAKGAADLGFHADGSLKESMPFHNEMSDAIFMGGPILAELGDLTKDFRYFDMCVKHVRFMQKLCLREDNLYRHSPLDEAAWGRGNGFPALGMAWILTRFPKDHPEYPFMLKSFKDHMQALAKHQDPMGMWHQVIDEPGSYREMTSTCMITLAMTQGVWHGWIEMKDYAPKIDLAWHGINTRIGEDGTLVNVCTGTGKQKDLTAYFHRKAILGRDDRGGAMAMMFAAEPAIK